MTALAASRPWRELSRAELDAAYNNSAAVAHSAATVAGWEQRSASLRARMPAHLDLRYGSLPRNRIDFFRAKKNAPTLVFFHGGYWQSRAKEAFSCFAVGPLACGLNVALVGYTLAPEASLDAIVAETRAAMAFLSLQLPALGAKRESMILCGWSAGAQLAAMVLDSPGVVGALLISGVYDLEPVRHCYVNDKLGLDAAMAERNSPLLHLPATCPPVRVVVGGAELPELRRQSSEFACAREKAALPGEFAEIPGADHFSILEQLERPDGMLCEMVSRLAHGDAAA